jgi:predicted RNase H-like HicB family nuclease
MKRVYPVVFTPDGDWYVVYVPDFDIVTQGEGLADAIDMARDAINLMGVNMEDEGKEIPDASHIGSVNIPDKGFVSLVDCDFDEYRKSLENRAVKKNCTLPSWLNKKAEAANVNFSQILQEALIEKLGLKD